MFAYHAIVLGLSLALVLALIAFVVLIAYNFSHVAAWVFPPPLPLTSDVVEVSYVRKRSDGTLIRFTLSGDAASRYGYLVQHAVPLTEFNELLPSWKREVVKSRNP